MLAKLGLTGLQKWITTHQKKHNRYNLLLGFNATLYNTRHHFTMEMHSKPWYKQGIPTLCYCYTLYNSFPTIYKHCAKWQRNSKEIKYCCVHTRLAPSFGSGDTSRISMIYKWHFCRSHILPLISVRYCKTNSLNRNSGTPLCTYYRKRPSHFLFIYSWWLHRITDEAGREVWRSPCPTPLPKADSARAGSPRRYSVRFSVSPETGDSITSLGNLFYCSATLAVRRVL